MCIDTFILDPSGKVWIKGLAITDCTLEQCRCGGVELSGPHNHFACGKGLANPLFLIIVDPKDQERLDLASLLILSCLPVSFLHRLRDLWYHALCCAVIKSSKPISQSKSKSRVVQDLRTLVELIVSPPSELLGTSWVEKHIVSPAYNLLNEFERGRKFHSWLGNHLGQLCRIVKSAEECQPITLVLLEGRYYNDGIRLCKRIHSTKPTFLELKGWFSQQRASSKVYEKNCNLHYEKLTFVANECLRLDVFSSVKVPTILESQISSSALGDRNPSETNSSAISSSLCHSAAPKACNKKPQSNKRFQDGDAVQDSPSQHNSCQLQMNPLDPQINNGLSSAINSLVSNTACDQVKLWLDLQSLRPAQGFSSIWSTRPDSTQTSTPVNHAQSEMYTGFPWYEQEHYSPTPTLVREQTPLFNQITEPWTKLQETGLSHKLPVHESQPASLSAQREGVTQIPEPTSAYAEDFTPVLKGATDFVAFGQDKQLARMSTETSQFFHSFLPVPNLSESSLYPPETLIQTSNWTSIPIRAEGFDSTTMGMKLPTTESIEPFAPLPVRPFVTLSSTGPKLVPNTHTFPLEQILPIRPQGPASNCRPPPFQSIPDLYGHLNGSNRLATGHLDHRLPINLFQTPSSFRNALPTQDEYASALGQAQHPPPLHSRRLLCNIMDGQFTKELVNSPP